MDWIEPLSQSLRNSGGSFIIGVLVLVFGSTAMLSERTMKEKFGAFGMFARWWQGRKEKAVQEEEDLLNRRTADLWDEIRRVDDARKRDRERFLIEIRELRTSERLKHKYTIWSAERVRDLEVWAATNGFHLPTPKILPFLEWVSEYETERFLDDEDEEEDE